MVSIIFNILTYFSLIALSVASVSWYQRSKTGFRMGEKVPLLPWNNLFFGTYILILIFVQFQFLLLGSLLNKFDMLSSPSRKACFLVLSQCLLYVLLIFLTRHWIQRLGTNWRDAFGFRGSPILSLFPSSTLLLIALTLPILTASLTSQFVLKKLGIPMDSQSIFSLLSDIHNPVLKSALIGMAIFGAPICEELLFRGMIYNWLKKTAGFVPALFLNSLIFAIIHYHLPSLLPLFVLAIGFTLIYEWTGNLASSMFMHALFNTISLILFFLKSGWGSSPTSG